MIGTVFGSVDAASIGSLVQAPAATGVMVVGSDLAAQLAQPEPAAIEAMFGSDGARHDAPQVSQVEQAEQVEQVEAAQLEQAEQPVAAAVGVLAWASHRPSLQVPTVAPESGCVLLQPNRPTAAMRLRASR
jgi:hypothetical protein